MSGIKKLLVGLGNPGPLYAFTFHNLGFIFLDVFAEKLKIAFRPAKGEFYIAETEKFILIKPITYMNNSGIAVKELIKERGNEFKEMVVIYDDRDLPMYRIKMKFGGSSGGHRGVESIIYHLETEDFWRVKIGIGRPPEGLKLRDYVLSKIPEESFKIYIKEFEEIVDLFIKFDDLKKVQMEINTRFRKCLQDV